MGRNSRGFLTGITTWWRKKIIAVRHSFYRKRLVRRLTNLAPSILSLDCVGGVMAHDLRLRFKFPDGQSVFRILRGFYRLCGGFALLFAGGTVRMSLCVRGGASLSRRHAERKRHATRYKDPFSALPLFRRGQGKMARAQRSS
mgnify:CR=1 FL=1